MTVPSFTFHAEDNSVWAWGWPASGRLGHSFAADGEGFALQEWHQRLSQSTQSSLVQSSACNCLCHALP